LGAWTTLMRFVIPDNDPQSMRSVDPVVRREDVTYRTAAVFLLHRASG
jgi:hypothetical protein